MKKIIKGFPILVLSVILTVIYIFLFIQSNRQLNQEMTKQKHALNEQLTLYKKELATEEVKNNPELSEVLNYSVETYQKKIAGITGDKKQYLGWIIEDTSDLSQSLGNMHYDEGAVQGEVIQKTNEKYRLIQENNIAPIYPLTYLSDFYELSNLSKESLTDWKKMNKQYYTKGYYHLWYLVKDNYLLIGLLLLFVGLFAPYAQSLRHRKLYKAEGIHYVKVYMSSFFSKVVLFFGLMGSVLGITFMVTSASKGTGSLAYPVLTGSSSMWSMTFISLGDYLVKVLVLCLFTGLFLLSLSHLIEACLTISLVALFVEIVVLLVGLSILPFSKWNPFSYLYYDKVITTGFNTTFTSSDWSLQQMLIVLLVGAVCCTLLGLVVSGIKNKRD